MAEDPDSLTTILGICLDEKSHWAEPLELFIKYLNFIITNEKESLPEPYADLTDNFLFVSMPNITRKCLCLEECKNDTDGLVADFLFHVISTAIFVVNKKKSAQIVPLINEMFDSVQSFYICNGRVHNQQFSQHFYNLAHHAISKQLPTVLINIFGSSDDFRIEDFEACTTLFQLLAHIVGNNNLFVDPGNAILKITESLDHFAIETDKRHIPYRKLLAIITSLISFDKSEELTNTLFDILMHFLDIDIIDIKLSGIKLCVTLYIHVIPNELIFGEYYQGTFAYVLGQASNFEAISLLKPVLIKFAENDCLSNDIIDCMWGSVKNLPPSVISKGYELFSDIALKVKTIDHILDLVLKPTPNIDILCKLVSGPQFATIAVKELIKLAEENKEQKAIEALVKVASSGTTVDLSALLPDVFANIENKENLKNHILLINAILLKTPTPIDSSIIVSNFAKNIPLLSSPDISEIISAISSILIRTGSKISSGNLSSIFSNCSKDKSSDMITIAKAIFPEDAILFDLSDCDSMKVISDIIEQSSFNYDLFGIVRHLYTSIKNSEFLKIILSSLWKALLSPETKESHRKAISELLLTFSDYKKVPERLCEFVKICMDKLMVSTNVNAALFINDILDYTSKYVLLENFGLEAHCFVVPEDLIKAKITFSTPISIVSDSGVETKTNELEETISNQANIANLITLISSKLKRDVTSIILYSKGKSVPNYTKLSETDLSFEARFRAEYERVPPFTMENHPISLFENFGNKNENENEINEMRTKYVERLLELLDLPVVGEHIYDVLIQIPTPSQFSNHILSSIDCLLNKIKDELSKTNSSSSFYYFLYSLHYLAKHLDEMPDKTKYQTQFEALICDHFEVIVPEARYLLILLLDKDTKNEKLVTKVLYQLCIETNPRFFTRIMRKLWSLVSDFQIDLPIEVLKTILLNDSTKFFELAMNSLLVKNQKFEKFWEIFDVLLEKEEDKIKFAKIFSKIDIPSTMYDVFVEKTLPLFYTLDESIMEIFAKISTKCNSFPTEKVANFLIDSYIRCNSQGPPKSISSYPFQLMLNIIKSNKENEGNKKMRNEIFGVLNQTIPEVAEWNYSPTDSFKCNKKCGLNNLGATCYMNSVLQQLFNIEPFRNFVISTNNFIDPTMIAMHKLFTEMFYSDRKYIDMNSFVSSCSWYGMPINPKEQQDANEFLLFFISFFEMYPEIYTLFNFELEVRFASLTENDENENKKVLSSQKTSFTVLPLVVVGQNSIKDSLTIFNLPETIEGYKVDDKSQPINVESTSRINTLPPYLFIQLKRFDYSIETGTRMKIDNKYEFEDLIDFKDYTNFSGETRFRLIGVILHQGDANAGHYISYAINYDSTNENNKWKCINDTGVTIVSDNIMKNEAFGSPQGSTAYLLLYERFDAPAICKSLIDNNGICSLIPDEPLVQSVQNNNLRLRVDSIYFTSYFADFINELLNEGESSSEEKDEESNSLRLQIILKFYLNILVHSSLEDPLNKLTDTFINKFRKEEAFIYSFCEFIQDKIHILLDIMTLCTNKAIRIKFSDMIAEIFKNSAPECVLMIVIVAQMEEWFPAILTNFRNGFDFFKLFADYASIDDERLNNFNELDIMPLVISFVTDSFIPFIQNKDNKITKERFRRLCDMTWIFKLLEIVHYPINEIIDPKFIKWCFGSEKHQAAFVHLLATSYIDEAKETHAIEIIEKLADHCDTPISEYLIAELAINSPIMFKIPTKWIKKYISSETEQKHALRAICDLINGDFSLFQKFASNQSQLFTHLLFSSDIEVREDFLIAIKKFASANNTNILSKDVEGGINETDRLDSLASILFPLIEKIPGLSKQFFKRKPEYQSKNPPPDMFLGLGFLEFLSEIAPKINNLKDYTEVVEKSLCSLNSLMAKRDEHTIMIAQIASIMLCSYQPSQQEQKQQSNSANVENNVASSEIKGIVPTVPIQLVYDIGFTIAHMALPEHKHLDSLLRRLFNGLVIRYNDPTLKTELFVPEELKTVLFKSALSKDLKIYKKPAIDLLKTCGKRYATASRVLKYFFVEMNNLPIIDMANVYEILGEYGDDVIKSNISILVNGQCNRSLSLIVTHFYSSIKDNIHLLIKMSKFLDFVFEKLNTKALIDTVCFSVMKENNSHVLSLVRFVSDERNRVENRIAALSIVSKWISVTYGDVLPKANSSDSTAYKDEIILSHFKNIKEAVSNNEEAFNNINYNEIIDTFGKTLIENCSNEKIASRLAFELAASFEMASEISDRPKTIEAIEKVVNDERAKKNLVNEKFVHDSINAKLFQNIWKLPPSSPASATSSQMNKTLFTLTIEAKPFLDDQTIREIKEVSQQYADKEPTYADLSSIL